MPRYDTIEEHVAAVQAWLSENVKSPPTPNRIRLHSFQKVADRPPLWTFTLEMDGEDFEGFEYSFSLQTGASDFQTPSFHSPLGAPCTYTAVHLTRETSEAIHKALAGLMPALRPMGVDPQTGQTIDHSTPLSERFLDPNGHQQAVSEMNQPGFSLTATLHNE